MIRLTYLLRRKPEISFEDFQRYWREIHGPLVASHSQRLNILRYVQVHTITDPDESRPEGDRGKMLKPWEGVAELWFESREVLEKNFADPAARAAMDELLRDEQEFIEFAESPLWLAYECPQINPAPETLVATPDSPLVKFYYPLNHHADRELEEVQLYWRMTHGPLVRRFGPAMQALKYVQVHRLDDEFNQAMADARGAPNPAWTGHAELWFDQNNQDSRTPEAREAGRVLVEDEAKFIDFSRSSMWTGKELTFIDRRR